MGIRRQLVGVGIVCGALAQGVAQSGPTADWGYAAVLQLLVDTHADPVQVRPKLVGKTIGATLTAARDGLFVVALDDGVFFECAKKQPAFKGGAVVSKVIRYEAPDQGEGGVPHLTLEDCAN